MVIAALDDVLERAGKTKAGAAAHEAILGWGEIAGDIRKTWSVPY